MPDRRVFTLEEASALLPRLSAIIARQLERRSDIEGQLAVLAERTGEVPEGVVVAPDDPPDVRALKHDLLDRLNEYQTGWGEVEDMGAVVKDARTGLLDFYSRVEGKLVFLCWRYGEDAIAHYHDVDAGFANRKPIVGAVKARLYN
jgi:hypothetical protein